MKAEDKNKKHSHTEKAKISEEEIKKDLEQEIEKIYSSDSAVNDEVQEKAKEKAEQKAEEKVTVKENKEQEYLLMAQRIQAEFDNYRKRTQKAEADARADGIIDAVKKFLPVLDSFYSATLQNTNEEFLKANSIIINQLNKALEDLGVKKIDAKGQKFDHNFHNAIMMEKVDDTEPGIVLEVFQEGYMLGNKVIRYSVVKVSE